MKNYLAKQAKCDVEKKLYYIYVWSHIPHCWKSHVAAHFNFLTAGFPSFSVLLWRKKIVPEVITAVQ